MRPSTNAIPTVDLDVWRADPKAVAAQVDTALRRAGFLLVTGHGVDAALRAGVRAAARRFFALPDEAKQRYAVRIGGRGWLAPGVEANGLVEGTETPPDLKVSFAVGPDAPAARRRSVPDRAAHRLRHGHRARPGAGSGRAAGVRRRPAGFRARSP
jgi:isopenicillin N synthase-like dioxygenase